MTKNFPKSMKIIDLISKKLKNNLYTGNMRKMTSSFIIIKLFKTSNKKNTLRCRGKKKKKKRQVIYRGRATTTEPKRERITADVSLEIMQERGWWIPISEGLLH